MDSVAHSFNKATGWNEDNFYENVIATSEGMFQPTPHNSMSPDLDSTNNRLYT